MHKVVDQNGNVVNGIKKDSVGGIVVDDISSYNKYIREKKLLERIDNLEKEIIQLKSLLGVYSGKSNI